MEVVTTGEQISAWAGRYDGPCVLVPTMGALHDGHMALVAQAKEAAGQDGCVMVSIYVNPIQFDRVSDLDAYPRPLEDDLAKCEQAGVDVVFAPARGEMYFPDRSTIVSESLLSSTLCGATRPGHFDGVCTVVLKLFMMTRCDVAIFGEKDFQQLAIIRRMVRDLNVPVIVLEGTTVREEDGLVMSSRNVRLSIEQRADAPRIQRALQAAVKKSDVAEILATAREEIESTGMAKIDYLEVVDAENLQVVSVSHRPSVLATAVFYGDVRLIDHVTIG